MLLHGTVLLRPKRLLPHRSMQGRFFTMHQTAGSPNDSQRDSE
jgi:hypothetical protein